MPVALDQLLLSTTPTIAAVPDKISVADAQSMGPSAPIQYTEPKPPPDLIQRGEEDIEKPFIQVQHTLGASMSWLGDNIKDETPFGDLGSRIAKAGIVMQERSTKNLKENFSNFTPNMLDNLVGAVPTVAGFLGLATLSTPAIAGGAAAVAGGLGVGAEEFGKFKDQGKSTPAADALAAAIGVPTGGVMALGFAKVGELVEPWFTKMLGSTLSKVLGDKAAILAAKAVSASTAGAVGMGAQAAVTDTGEAATGVLKEDEGQPITSGSAAVVKTLTDTAHNAIMGGVLGGGLGVSYALAQHAKFVNILTKVGFNPKEANTTATAVLGQGAHVLMDKIDQHLAYTKDENSRIQAPEVKGEVQSNVLERTGIPQVLNFPSVEKEAESDGDVVEMSKDFKYVKLRPLNIQKPVGPKATAQEIRKKYVGGRDQQMLANSNLHSDLRKLVPAEIDQRAMFRGDRSREFFELALRDIYPLAAADQLHQELRELSGRESDPAKDGVNATAEKIASMRPVIERILKPSYEMKKAMGEGQIYYKEQGLISKALGTINEIKENYYSSRLYKASPLADFVKNLKSVNKKFSAHSMQRYYPDSWLAMADGKEFRTENFADALYDHATEMTQVNYSRQLQNAMVEQKPAPLAAWVREGAMPPGWKQIGTSRKLVFRRDFKTGELQYDENDNPVHHFVVFAAPTALADGLKPLTDPNYLKLIPGYQTLDKVQGFAKTGLLSASFFHHYTFATQTLASFDGYKTLAELPMALKNDLMSEPGFRELEARNVKYGLTTQATHNIQDVWADMNKGDDRFSKVLQAPVVKQITDVLDVNTDLLFKGMQRYIKNMTMARNLAKWEGDHPGHTQEELDEAAYGYAKSTNDAFGGQNWEMLGWNRTQVALARFFLLAPDWVVSNFSAAGRALTSGGTAGSQARWTLASGIIGGLAANNILNYIRNGHSTLENKKGHQFEFEAAPDVWVNNVRGGPGEVLKLMSDIIESEGGQGFARYAEGKQSPLLSAYTRFSSGVNYSGSDIWRGHSVLEKNINGFWNIAAPAMGMPIGVTGSADYLMREPHKSLLGFSLVASGMGRFSLSNSGRRR
jgi:hypothetical protein